MRRTDRHFSFRIARLAGLSVAGLLLGAWLGGAAAYAEAAPSAGSPQTESRSGRVSHLTSAIHLTRLGRAPFAIEHLRRIDPLELDAAEGAAFAQLLAYIVTHDPRLPGLEGLVRHCALALRGDLEKLRGQPDRALPWNVWAASTSNAFHSEDFSDHWARLSRLFTELSWHDHAAEAADRASIPRPPPPFEGWSAPTEGPFVDCRDWHDASLVYKPDDVIRQRDETWAQTIEDLEAWHEVCQMEPLTPSCLEPRGGPDMPIRTLRLLRARWSGRSSIDIAEDRPGERLLCPVKQSIVLTPPVIEQIDGLYSLLLSAKILRARARALVQARTGRTVPFPGFYGPGRAISTRTSFRGT